MSGTLNRLGRPSVEDDERLSQLYDETSRDLLAFLLRRCPTAEDAADALSETYRIAWEKRKRVPPGREARPWLFGVARNVARRERANDQQRAAATQQLALAAENSSARTSPQEDAVTNALSELSPLDRDIVLMLSAGGLTPREVAKVLALSPNAVRVRAHRAREKLRGLLASGETQNPDLVAAENPQVRT